MNWLTIELSEINGIIFSAALIYIILLVLVKISGLRSFAKMSAFDFAVTIAVGSIIADTVVTKSTTVAEGTLGIAMLFLLQTCFAIWRRYRENTHLENKPLLLMDGNKILNENMRSANITEADLMAKLREANVIELSEVKAVVLEATGDVSVLHSKDDKKLADCLLKQVRR
ncbi:MAG: hypothetical protein CMH25_01350 [Micavibrio sp.]|nr:hypothetical protein [Micavibrio sp.]|tara:strand:+ start:272447 stop:272959 length:513 start_codon:yes stop_codon:yes gene_type:complete